MFQFIASAIRRSVGHPDGFPAFSVCARNAGLRNYLAALAHYRRMPSLPPGDLFYLTSRHCRGRLACRAASTDFSVYVQIFLEREYACLDELRDPRWIIDCGANVGYSSAYFATRFPQARIIAVEPDPANFQMLSTNTASFGDRVRPIQSGLWSHPATLQMSKTDYRGGGAWARQVTECAPGESGFGAVDMNELIEMTGRQRIDLLKIDIEGAEAVVFSRGYKAWLPQIDVLVIELHEDTIFGNGRTVVERVMAEEGFTQTNSGELSIFQRRR